MSPQPSDDPVLLDIISSALEMLDQGIEPPIEQLCGDRDDLVAEVRVAVRIADELPAVRERAANIDPYLGRTIGRRYRLQARLGSGAMGVVYEADDQELNRRVAVKILRVDLLTAEEAAARFLREAELMAAIQHPSVATIFDRGRTDAGEQYLVMELLEGRSLSDLLEIGWERTEAGALEGTDWVQEELGGVSLTEPNYLRLVVEWTADLAGGLGAVHKAGIYHRDVKPSNVFVGRDGKPQLLDFGIASSEEHATLMREGGALGTPAYMPPEALSEKSTPAPALDVYGLTATLYHMLVMRAPYSGSPSQIIAAMSQSEPKPAQRLRPGLPRDLQAILDKGMARRVSQRYGTMLELESDLRAFLQYRPVTARPITPLKRLGRKLRHSTAFHAAAAVGILWLAIVGGLRWKEAESVRRHEAFMDVYEHFPQGLTLGAPSSRKFAEAEERTAIQALLDEAVHWSDEPLPARSLRASFRLDHGDTKGAAEDMAVVASALDTPYTRELSNRYTRLASQVGSEEGLDLRALPDPESPMDSYLAAYHYLRTGKKPPAFLAARELLELESLAEFAPAQELLIPLIDKLEFSRDDAGLTDEELAQRALGTLENYSRTVRLEERLGRRTATTAFLLGTTLESRKLYEAALEPYHEALELSPWSYGTHLNLGIAYRRLNMAEGAEKHLGAAMQLRPDRLPPYTTLARHFIFTGDLQRARELVARAPFLEPSEKPSRAEKKDQRTRSLLEADIEFEEVLRLRGEGEFDRAREAAERTLQLYKDAALWKGSWAKERERPEARICEAIVSGKDEVVFGIIIELLEEDPLRWRQLSTLLDWMPDRLEEGDTESMHSYIRALRESLMLLGR